MRWLNRWKAKNLERELYWLEAEYHGLFKSTYYCSILHDRILEMKQKIKELRK